MRRNKTLTDRVNALHTERLDALTVFTKASDLLDSIAEDYDAVVQQARAEALERNDAADAATIGAQAARQKARKIRELLG